MALPRSWLFGPILGAAIGGFTVGLVSYRVATYGQTFQVLNEQTDPLPQGRFGKAFNPYKNRTLSDIYVARVPLAQIDPSLLFNDTDNKSRLIERYTAGLFGRWGKLTFFSFCMTNHLPLKAN